MTGIAPLCVFLVLALSGASTATTTDATAVGDLDHEVCMYENGLLLFILLINHTAKRSNLTSVVAFWGRPCVFRWRVASDALVRRIEREERERELYRKFYRLQVVPCRGLPPQQQLVFLVMMGVLFQCMDVCTPKTLRSAVGLSLETYCCFSLRLPDLDTVCPPPPLSVPSICFNRTIFAVACRAGADSRRSRLRWRSLSPQLLLFLLRLLLESRQYRPTATQRETLPVLTW